MRAPEQWREYQNSGYWLSDQGRVKHVLKSGKERMIHPYVRFNRKGCKVMFFRIKRKQVKLKDILSSADKRKMLDVMDKIAVYTNNEGAYLKTLTLIEEKQNDLF